MEKFAYFAMSIVWRAAVHGQAAFLGAMTLGAGLLIAHGARFYYLESVDLPISDTKVHYSKGELEKLEKKGVKIVVTTKEAYNVKGKAPVAAPTDDSKTAGATDITASSSAGCI